MQSFRFFSQHFNDCTTLLFSMGITMGKFPKMDFWSFHELGACQSGLVCTAELVFDSSFQGYPTCLCSQPMAYGQMAIYGHIWLFMAIGCKYGHVGYPYTKHAFSSISNLFQVQLVNVLQQIAINIAKSIKCKSLQSSCTPATQLVVLIFNLGGKVVSDLPNLANVVLDDEGHVGRH